ncbi:peptidoglycan DD-metalloendopeptidase family protein [Hyphomonas johnsonii]|uniref:Peptidase M23 n=1 Tax=Hyphomonas johnsonii MHS-2 TaxID=1280950 RepID=A0A059FJJ3_9PROT|nr:peptidoglycan DD-metalloendopeptidase family protein [Hyphomonas johnsonii]KCZ90638.1 peptidase M23 [Hyphomonas johnsonii MHS-2]
MSIPVLVLVSLTWSALLWTAASLLCRLRPLPHQAQAIWRVAAGMTVLPFLAALVLPGLPARQVADLPDLPMMEAFVVNSGAATAASPPAGLLAEMPSLATLVLGMLLLGWGLRFAAWLLGEVRLQHLKRASTASGLSAMRWARSLGLKHVPEIRLIPAGSPFVAGLARPVIYLPQGIRSSADVDQVIAHECVHLKRGDLVTRPVERLVSDVFWFSPFAWGMRGALDYWREAVVDAGASRLTGDRIAYARALTLVARLSRPVVALPVAAFILPRKGSLKMRLTHLLHDTPRQPKRLAAAAALALVLAVPVALAQGMLMKDAPIAQTAHYSHAVLDKAKLTSRFGTRVHPITKQPRMHNGIDLAEEEGKPIYAPADGEVLFADMKDDYGNLVELRVAADTRLRFGQMSVIDVSDGQQVKAGDVIGRIGQSGTATGPHLHFEVWHGDRPEDPEAEPGLVLADVLKEMAPRSTGPAPAAPAPQVQPAAAPANAPTAMPDACAALDTWFRDTPTPDSWAARLDEARIANATLGLEISPKAFNPETTAYPKPIYPRAAAASKKSGFCQVLFDIGPDGHPVNAEANCSDPVFVESARAMPDAEFVPAEVDGKAVTLSGVIYPLQYCIE